MTSDRRQTGNRGEDLAASFLRAHGYGVLDRNFRCPAGELDIVAEQDDQLVFVEVRTRRAGCLVRPEETVSWTKASRVARLAEHYMAARHLQDRPWRVDVIAVELDSSGEMARLEHYPDAMTDVLRRAR